MVVQATTDVFGTMLNLPLDTSPSHLEPVHPATYDGVVALIGVAGPWTGTGRISMLARICLRDGWSAADDQL